MPLNMVRAGVVTHPSEWPFCGHNEILREREVPAVRRIAARVEPERIIEVVCKAIGVGREELLRKGRKGHVRGVLMEMLYRYGGLNQREIGAMIGVDYSSVSVGRKRLWEEVGKNRSLKRRIEEIQRAYIKNKDLTPSSI
jgi:putative transposase